MNSSESAGGLARKDFLDRVAAASLIPGPSSTEVCIFYRAFASRVERPDCRGALGFIIPAAVLVTLIAAAYVRFGALPQVEGILRAIKPAVIAIIVQALWNLGKTAAKTWVLALIGVAAAGAEFCGRESADRFELLRAPAPGSCGGCRKVDAIRPRSVEFACRRCSRLRGDRARVAGRGAESGWDACSFHF